MGCVGCYELTEEFLFDPRDDRESLEVGESHSQGRLRKITLASVWRTDQSRVRLGVDRSMKKLL